MWVSGAQAFLEGIPLGLGTVGTKAEGGVQKLPTAGLQSCWGRSADTERQAEAASILSDSQGCGRSSWRGLLSDAV